MSTTPLTDAINALTQYANETTGASDTTLSDAVGTLVAGYGGGGGISIDDLATNSAPSGAITLGSGVTTIADYAFAGKPITSITAPNVTDIKTYALQNTQIDSITDANFPVLGVSVRYMLLLRMSSLKNIKLTGGNIALNSGSGGLRENANLLTAEFPNAARDVGSSYAYIGNAFFYGDNKMTLADVGYITTIGANVFYNCNKLATLILRSGSVVALGNANAFQNTPMRGYQSQTGTIYVPSSLISSYQTAAQWATLYNDGHCTFAALEGSQYE